MLLKAGLILLALRGTRTSAQWTPGFFTDELPAPLAYYYLDEGSGWDLKESVSNNTTSGTVVYDADHQINTNHTGPNWVDDEYFGRTISCGLIENKTHPTLGAIQKDTIELEDIDYGHSGSWAWSVWFRHEAGMNFPDYQREQFFGHGDPLQATTTINQVHIQLEKSGTIRTILMDNSDVDRYVYSNQTDDRFPEQTDPLCYDKSECRRACSASSDTQGNIRDYDNGEWHQLVLSTRTDGEKGYNLYIDGTLRSASPYMDGIGIDKGYGNSSEYVNWAGVGGAPIDPIGPLRLCGRKKPAAWSDGEEDLAAWDPKRYFRGQVAHFSVWDSALSQDQISVLYTSYMDQYGLTAQTESPTVSTQSPTLSPNVPVPTVSTNGGTSPTATPPTATPPTPMTDVNGPTKSSEDFELPTNPIDTDDDEGGGLGTVAILGIAAGAVVFLTIIATIVWFTKGKQKQSEIQTDSFQDHS